MRIAISVITTATITLAATVVTVISGIDYSLMDSLVLVCVEGERGGVGQYESSLSKLCPQISMSVQRTVMAVTWTMVSVSMRWGRITVSA